MLVLSRQRGETVMIGDAIDVTIIDVRGEKVRLGINAPRDVSVHRKEIYEQIREQNRAAAQMKVEDVPKAGARPTPVPVGPARPESSGLFQVWKDPESGIESFVLRQKAAPLGQGFDATQSPFGGQGRYLWFYAAFPPGGDADYGRTLGVVDLQEQEVRHFPETQFGSASPQIDPSSGDAYWCTGAEVYRRSPRVGDAPVRVARYDAAAGKCGPSIASRLSRSADGKWLSVDAAFDDEWHIGAIAVDTGATEVWHVFDEPVTAQFNPADPELMLVVAAGGQVWTLRRGGKPEPLLAGKEAKGIRSAWWSADGKSIWFVDERAGTGRVDVAGGERVIVCPSATVRAHVSGDGRAVVGDSGARLTFYNLNTGKEAAIVTSMPVGPFPREHYATDPRPQFCLNGRYVSYTTTVNGRVEVAVTLVETLLGATR